MRERLLIKVVPDGQPDDDGEWIDITWAIQARRTRVPHGRGFVAVIEALAPFVPEGKHMVALRTERT
jgi:hypothetical protein